MTDYKSRVLSVRIDSQLLEAVRERARADGRSVSGEIVFFLRERVEPQPARRPPQKISGWLSHRGASLGHAEFRRSRVEASGKLRASAHKKARRK